MLLTACAAMSSCGGRLLEESSSQGTGPTPTTNTTPAGVDDVQQSLMARWNAAAAAAPLSGFDFRWNVFNQFPHPTFKGGTAEAYQAFAKVLLAFFDRGDDFDFLAQNHLFKLRLDYVFPGGQNGLGTNFEELARYLSTSGTFPFVPEDTRSALEAYVHRIETAESGMTVDPHPEAGATAVDASYLKMCSNYCNALAETNIYSCAKAGRDCRDEVLGWGDLCYRERCVPMLVEQSLCFHQCDILATFYGPVCAGDNVPAPLCPLPAADHDQACRDGCALQQ
jgi:hypothetical protein